MLLLNNIDKTIEFGIYYQIRGLRIEKWNLIIKHMQRNRLRKNPWMDFTTRKVYTVNSLRSQGT
jgi:hypothetical protein